jgi:hypothetical protein
MALLAEQVVEEWLSRQGYFTIRGIKLGYDELDLLAIKKLPNGNWDNFHIEVQVSIRPISYISDLTTSRQKEFDINGSKNATKRTDQQLEKSVGDWIEKKFNSIKKNEIRKELSDSDDWKYLFVYGNVKDQKEIEIIKTHNIQTKFIGDIIQDLQNRQFKYTTASATDIIDLLGFIK